MAEDQVLDEENLCSHKKREYTSVASNMGAFCCPHRRSCAMQQNWVALVEHGTALCPCRTTPLLTRCCMRSWSGNNCRNRETLPEGIDKTNTWDPKPKLLMCPSVHDVRAISSDEQNKYIIWTGNAVWSKAKSNGWSLNGRLNRFVKQWLLR